MLTRWEKRSFPLVLYVVIFFVVVRRRVTVLRKKIFEVKTTVFFVVVALRSGKCCTKKKDVGKNGQVSMLLLVRLADKRRKTNGSDGRTDGRILSNA